jgi:hypothetical protein
MNTALIITTVILAVALGIAIVACTALTVALRRTAKAAAAYLEYAALREKERDAFAQALNQSRGQLN